MAAVISLQGPSWRAVYLRRIGAGPARFFKDGIKWRPANLVAVLGGDQNRVVPILQLGPLLDQPAREFLSNIHCPDVAADLGPAFIAIVFEATRSK
jgi:hypothetical protein